MNFPETRLRSWQPRRPSAKLKYRIFEAPPAPAHSFSWSLRCLAPAAACLLVAIAAFNKGVVSTESSRPESLLGMIGSNLLTSVPGRYLQSENGFSPLTFEWTNRAGSTSSIRSFSPGKVN